MLKGLALDSLGKYQEAISYYDKAMKIEPDNIDELNKKMTLDKLNSSKVAVP
jgi:tetratricopeptide (TPR) repeat protein